VYDFQSEQPDLKTWESNQQS